MKMDAVSGKTPTSHKLDAKPYSAKVRRATEAAQATLERYGQPTMTLAELREALDCELGDVSLAELIIRERESGPWMALFYLDTSAIVKRYRGERGTQVVDQLLGSALPADRFYTSFLSVLELYIQSQVTAHKRPIAHLKSCCCAQVFRTLCIASAVLRLAKGKQVTESAAAQMLSRFPCSTIKAKARKSRLGAWPANCSGTAWVTRVEVPSDATGGGFGATAQLDKGCPPC